MEQLILHLIGDYVTQSDWMAQNKRIRNGPALAHALVYSLPFLLLTGGHGPLCWLVIFSTHLLIDRFGVARYVVWVKNFIAPTSRLEGPREIIQRCLDDGTVSRPVMLPGEGQRMQQALANPRRVTYTLPWSECCETGYPPQRPAWLSVWLLIACDNTLHLAINYAALRWL